MRAIDFDIPASTDDENPRTRQVSGEVVEQVESALVCVVEVFEDDDDRLHVGRVAQERGHGLQQPEAVFFRRARLGKIHVESVTDL